VPLSLRERRISTALTFGTNSCIAACQCYCGFHAVQLRRTTGQRIASLAMGVDGVNTEASRQTLTSASSTSSTVDQGRTKRAMETPVKRRPEHVDRNVATPSSARHARPWRGVAPSHNNKPDVTLVNLNTVKPPHCLKHSTIWSHLHVHLQSYLLTAADAALVPSCFYTCFAHAACSYP